MPPIHSIRPKGGSWPWNLGCEVLIGATACLAPWAFGSVDAWAEFGLVICVSVLAVAATIRSLRSNDPIRFWNAPGIAIAGLAVLAWIQTIPLPTGVYRTLDPSGFASLGHLIPPTTPQRVRGDDEPPIAPPSLTLSQDPDATFRPAVELTAAFILFQCAISLGGGYPTLRRFGLAITLNSCALALFALIQAVTWNGKIYGIRQSPIPEAWYSGGPFISYHHLAAYLNFGLGFALAFALGAGFTGGSRSGKKIPGLGEQRLSPLALYATGLIAVGVIGSHSRGGFLAMAVSGTVLLLVLRRQPLRVWIGMAVVLLFMALLLFAIGSASPLERLTTIWEASETGFNGRSQIWISSLRAWLANPVWGVGLGCFGVGTAPFYQFARESLYFHAENDYLEVLVEGGLLGFGLGILAFAAIARHCTRAYHHAGTGADRTIVVGGLFGLVALAVKSCADFPLHIPGVAVTGLVLCAYLSRIGLDTRRANADATGATTWATRGRAALALTTLVVLCTPLLWLSYGQTRDESALMRAGVPLPGTQWLTADYGRLPIDELEVIEVTLEKILTRRPNWSDGYLRLGMMYLSQYEQATTIAAMRQVQSVSDAIDAADPLWLHRVVHTNIKSESELEKLIEDDPIWLYLIPAAHNFLEARRCCRVRALPHAWLASLDYLVIAGETTSVHAQRALDQSGNDTRIMAVAARAALDVGDLTLAARCWRKALVTFPSRVDEIAQIAGVFLSPQQILDEVLSANATQIIHFADVLYSKPESKSARDLFLAEAIKRADSDPQQTLSQRGWIKAQAYARLDERDQARKLMEAALADEPDHQDWRGEYVDWLIRWGDPDEALNQARIGVYLHPENSGFQALVERATQARSRKLLEPAGPH